MAAATAHPLGRDPLERREGRGGKVGGRHRRWRQWQWPPGAAATEYLGGVLGALKSTPRWRATTRRKSLFLASRVTTMLHRIAFFTTML